LFGRWWGAGTIACAMLALLHAATFVPEISRPVFADGIPWELAQAETKSADPKPNEKDADPASKSDGEKKAGDQKPNDPAADPAEKPNAEPEIGTVMPAIGPRPRGEMKLPGDAQLLNGPKHDWVVFVNPEDSGTLAANTPIPPDIPEYVLVVEPLYPRPGTLQAMVEKINERIDTKVYVDRLLLDELPADEEQLLRNVIYEEMDTDELKLHTIKRAKEMSAETAEQSPDEGRIDLPELIIDYFRQEALRTSKQIKGATLKKVLINQVEKLTTARYQALRLTVMKDAESRLDQGLNADEKREMRRQRQSDRKESAATVREIRGERLKLLMDERSKLDLLNLILVDGGEQPEVRIRMRYVKEIIYHEDQMLQRVDELIEQQKLAEAFEMLYLLERQSPQWPGLTQRQSHLLVAEAIAKRNAGEWEAALVLLEESFSRDAKNAALPEQMGAVIDQLIQTALAEFDNRQARHFHGRLKALFPSHEVAARWEATWSAKTTELMTAAQSAFDEGRYEDATENVRLASHVWPSDPQLPGLYRRIVGRSQRLEVGVLRRVDTEPHLPWLTEIQERHHRLLYVDLFEVSRTQTQTHYSSRFFERWEPTNLGREAHFWLRKNRRADESLPLVSARVIADEIHRRIRPGSPVYDERLASYLESVKVKTPHELIVTFSRIPFEAETLFRFPVAADESPPEVQLTSATNAAGLAKVDVENVASPTNDNGSADLKKKGHRFFIHEQSEDRILYRRSIPEPDGLNEYHIAEIVERRFANPQKAMQALMRGEISMLANIDRGDLATLQNDDRFTVAKYGLPLTHLVQFHPRSTVFKNVQIRRALAYSIQREKILQEIVLKNGDASWGRLISAPYPRQHAAYSKLISERPFDVTMAMSLLFSVKKQFPDGIPVLKMACEPDPDYRAAAEKMIRDWARLGFQIELLPIDADVSKDASDGSPPWDIVYRTVTVEDPITDFWPLLCQEPTARVESLTFLPDWLRQELVELENANDFKTAIYWMHRLHEHLQNEAELIPLWETDEYFLYRKNIRGVPDQPIWSYQDVESWSLVPWYPTDTP
ncbi:MAG: ABC transporter substrate-binding protein, partial [Planctomycetaceae bacterium]